MTNLIVAKSLNKDTLSFSGRFQGQRVTQVLLSNRCVEEGKNYAVSFSEYEMVGTSLVITVSKMKEV